MNGMYQVDRSKEDNAAVGMKRAVCSPCDWLFLYTSPACQYITKDKTDFRILLVFPDTFNLHPRFQRSVSKSLMTA